MRLCFLDFETYWSTTHSLTKMSSINYVTHPDTEIISVAARFDEGGKKGKTQCVFGEDNIRNLLSRIDWSDTMVIGHNMSGFDSLILAWRFGVNPKMWGCTLAMARPHFQVTVGGSLKKVAAALGAGEKGSLEATNTKGKRYADFEPDEIVAMEEYNKLDVELCADIFYKLAKKTPAYEMKLIDRTTRMLTEPKFELDVVMLENALEEEKAAKQLMLLDIATLTGVYQQGMEEAGATAAVKKVLASAPKFAALLRDLGVEPPIKPSPTNPEKNVFALAKTDEAFIALQEHDDPLVAAAARARLGVKSTLLETRVQRFLETGAAVNGKMPVPLNYYAATTGRWGGGAGAGLNLQNLPRVSGKPTDALRKSLRAPVGHKVVVVDLSGVELRVNHFLWKAKSSTELFIADPEKADLYKDFASKLYSVPVAEVTKAQRQIGKIAHLGLGFGAGAQTFIRIAKTMGGVSMSEAEAVDVVKRWRTEYDSIRKGWRKCGDALVHIWNRAYGEAIDPWGLCVTHEEGIKTPVGMIRYPELNYVEEDKEFWYGEGRNKSRLNGPKVDENCIAAGTLVLTDAGWKRIETVRYADLVHDGEAFVPHGGKIYKAVQQCVSVDGVFMTPDHEVLDEYGRWVSADASPRPYRPDLRGVDGAQVRRAEAHEGYLGVSVRMRCATGEATQGCSQRATPRGDAELRVHDAGAATRSEQNPRNEQTPGLRGISQYARSLSASVAQGVGKLRRAWDSGVRAVAGSVRELLGGYGPNVYAGAGSGPRRQQWTVRTGELPMGYAQGKHYEQAKHTGGRHPRASGVAWNGEINSVLPAPPRAVVNCPSGQKESRKVYDILNAGPQHRFVVLGDTGPFIVHNCVQHLARCIMAEQMLTIAAKFDVVHTVHDEVVCIVDEARAQECLDFMLATMRTPPKWWPELVLWAEGSFGDSYGEAK